MVFTKSYFPKNMPLPQFSDPSEYDSQLVATFKKTGDEQVLNLLIERHTGIYNSMVSAFTGILNVEDMKQDGKTNIYNMVKSFDPTRGMKFGTYVGQNARFLCLTHLRNNKRNPLNNSFDIQDYYNEAPAVKSVEEYLTDDNSHNRDKIDEEIVMEYISKKVVDKRFLTIVKVRHFNPSGSLGTWMECGKAIGASYEGARQIYNKNRDILVKAFKKETV
jgi:hypothetical protein